jgi:hypothetical protein
VLPKAFQSSASPKARSKFPKPSQDGWPMIDHWVKAT